MHFVLMVYGVFLHTALIMLPNDCNISKWFLNFSLNLGFDISCKLCPYDLHQRSNPILGINKKNDKNLSPESAKSESYHQTKKNDNDRLTI